MTKPLDNELRDELIKNTREAGQDFLADVSHIRDIISSEKANAGEIRRMSAILRRLLVERALPAIASPRIGRVTIKCPDLKSVYVASRKHTPHFFLSGDVQIFGSRFSHFVIGNGAPAGFYNPPELDNSPIFLNVDSFIKQQVVCSEGNWVTRGDVIKYVANVANGVHFGSTQSMQDEILKKIRKQVMIKLKDGIPSLGFGSMLGPDPELEFGKDHIDGVLLELLSAAERVVTSPDVLRLEDILRSEA